MRIDRCICVFAALVLTQVPFARAAEQVDLLLALAMDVSRSMDQPKFLLQREGYAAAITNPQVLNAIDVSGDGTNNAGRDVQLARDQAVAKGIIVNGIVILTDIESSRNPPHTNPPGGIEKYYRDNVIGGPGAFVMVAEDFGSFGRAM